MDLPVTLRLYELLIDHGSCRGRRGPCGPAGHGAVGGSYLLVLHGFDIKLIGASKGGGVLVQGKGPNLPSPFLDPWWNRAAQGAGLLL
jgi:hypothetical protein